MKSVRLLPVVVFAASALLVFKGVGLVTNGGYVLTGVNFATAAGDGGHGGSAEASLAGPVDPTMVDTAPTLEDRSPTLGQNDAAAASGHGASTDAAAGAHVDEPPALTASSAVATRPECAIEIKADGAGASSGGHGAPAATDGGTAGLDCLDMTDARAMRVGEDGTLVPMGTDGAAGDTEQAILSRLGERRTELESRQQDLDARQALIDAAQKRLEERASQVAAMEAQIEALVAEKKKIEDDQFKSLISMYENMKPRDAAAIFDTIDLNVLNRVGRAMNPRKMAPIMAAMKPERAQELTVLLAETTPDPTVALADVPPAPTTAGSQLPQIVGQ